MRYLTVAEVLHLHDRIIRTTGGAGGVRDFGALVSAVTQPQMKFERRDLYTKLSDKAAALACSLIANHPFLDGNKRVGHAAMEVFLLLNGCELLASAGESERVIIGVAAGRVSRAEFVRWIREHVEAIR